MLKRAVVHLLLGAAGLSVAFWFVRWTDAWFNCSDILPLPPKPEFAQHQEYLHLVTALLVVGGLWGLPVVRRIYRVIAECLLLPDFLQVPCSDDPLHFASDYVPFLGREEEMEALMDFAEDPADFRIWSLTGPGGVGKSRLAIELSRRLRREDWHAGFRRRPLGEEWFPVKNTMIVVDDAVDDYDRTAQMLLRVSEHTRPWHGKLRVLLVDRFTAKAPRNSRVVLTVPPGRET